MCPLAQRLPFLVIIPASRDVLGKIKQRLPGNQVLAGESFRKQVAFSHIRVPRLHVMPVDAP